MKRVETQNSKLAALLSTRRAQTFAPILGAKFILREGYVAVIPPPDVLWYIVVAAQNVGFATPFSTNKHKILT